MVNEQIFEVQKSFVYLATIQVYSPNFDFLKEMTTANPAETEN